MIAGEPSWRPRSRPTLSAWRTAWTSTPHSGADPSEVEGYLEGFEIEPEALLELKARACNMQTGCFRLLDRTLSNVKRILADRGGGRHLKIIEQASSMMML